MLAVLILGCIVVYLVVGLMALSLCCMAADAEEALEP
jgi:hypothetical protein